MELYYTFSELETANERCFSVEDKNAQPLHHCFEFEKNVVFLTPKLGQKVRNLFIE
jgi:hypothetical protein